MGKKNCYPKQCHYSNCTRTTFFQLCFASYLVRNLKWILLKWGGSILRYSAWKAKYVCFTKAEHSEHAFFFFPENIQHNLEYSDSQFSAVKCEKYCCQIRTWITWNTLKTQHNLVSPYLLYLFSQTIVTVSWIIILCRLAVSTILKNSLQTRTKISLCGKYLIQLMRYQLT